MDDNLSSILTSLNKTTIFERFNSFGKYV